MLRVRLRRGWLLGMMRGKLYRVWPHPASAAPHHHGAAACALLHGDGTLFFFFSSATQPREFRGYDTYHTSSLPFVHPALPVPITAGPLILAHRLESATLQEKGKKNTSRGKTSYLVAGCHSASHCLSRSCEWGREVRKGFQGSRGCLDGLRNDI